jgi:hypothetical protein
MAEDHAPAEGASIAWESPEAVLADDTLSAAQKRRLLSDWLATIDAHLDSDEIAAADEQGEATLAGRIRDALDGVDGS